MNNKIMKKLNSLWMLFLGLVAFSACEDDNGSNPTYKDPTTFVLNTPALATNVYDLKKSQAVELTCSQPDYAYPTATTYSVEISLESAYKEINEAGVAAPNYTILPTKHTSAKIAVNAKEMATAMFDLYKATVGGDIPSTPIPLYVRLKASVSSNGMGSIYSNIIHLPKVLCYNVSADLVLPTTMYIVGSMNDWDWEKSIEMVPLHSNPGKFWSVVYFGDKAEMKFNGKKETDGKEVGYSEGLVTEASIALADVKDANGNIGVGKPGWYIVVVTAQIDGKAMKYQLEFLAPDIYSTGDPSGGYDVFDETRRFTVPENGTDDFVSPEFVAPGELRMCIKLESVDWWKSEFIILGGKIAYRADGGDQERVSVAKGQRAYLNFMTGKGSVK